MGTAGGISLYFRRSLADDSRRGPMGQRLGRTTGRVPNWAENLPKSLAPICEQLDQQHPTKCAKVGRGTVALPLRVQIARERPSIPTGPDTNRG
jgi:hypothetical protein